MAFVEIKKVADLLDLPPETRIRVNGKEKIVGDFDNLWVAGTPLLPALAALGQKIEIERVERVVVHDPEDFPTEAEFMEALKSNHPGGEFPED